MTESPYLKDVREADQARVRRDDRAHVFHSWSAQGAETAASLAGSSLRNSVVKAGPNRSTGSQAMLRCPQAPITGRKESSKTRSADQSESSPTLLPAFVSNQDTSFDWTVAAYMAFQTA